LSALSGTIAGMSNYEVDVIRDPQTNAITGVDVIAPRYVIGRWRQPHSDVWAESLRDKDLVRRLVREARGLPTD
jgi:hypothetical protein